MKFDCKKYNEFINRKFNEKLTKSEQQELIDHIKNCITCSKEVRTNEKLEDIIIALKKDIPEVENSVVLTNKIMSSIEINGQKSMAYRLSNLLSIFLDGFFYPRFRYALMLASIILIGIFIYQQFFIYNQVSTLNKKIHSLSEKAGSKKASNMPGLTKIRYNNITPVSNLLENMEESPYILFDKKDLDAIVKKYIELEKENEELKKVINENHPELLKLLNYTDSKIY